jgi:hypothetical protein
MPRRVVLISNALFGDRRTYRKTETKTRYAQPRLHKFSCVFCVVWARFGELIAEEQYSSRALIRALICAKCFQSNQHKYQKVFRPRSRGSQQENSD